jgi:hypothetical protein
MYCSYPESSKPMKKRSIIPVFAWILSLSFCYFVHPNVPVSFMSTRRPGGTWPSHLLQEQRLMHYALLPKGLAELVFLLFGQVALNELELLALDGLNNLV